MVRRTMGRNGIAEIAVAAVAVILLAGRPQTASPQGAPARIPDDAFAPTVPNEGRPAGPAPEGMVWIPGGEFSMGATASSEGLCEVHGVTHDALPVHRVYVDGYWMDATEVTNAQFARFVKATGYVTVAEQRPTPDEFPGAPAENLVAGSTVFTPTLVPVALNDHYQWWR
jgi:formylglycine-generating enzyme